MLPDYVYCVATTALCTESDSEDSSSSGENGIETLCMGSLLEFWLTPGEARECLQRRGDAVFMCDDLNHVIDCDHSHGIIVFHRAPGTILYYPTDVCTPILVEKDFNGQDVQPSPYLVGSPVMMRLGLSGIDDGRFLPPQSARLDENTVMRQLGQREYGARPRELQLDTTFLHFYAEHGFVTNTIGPGNVEVGAAFLFAGAAMGRKGAMPEPYVLDRRKFHTIAPVEIGKTLRPRWISK